MVSWRRISPMHARQCLQRASLRFNPRLSLQQRSSHCLLKRIPEPLKLNRWTYWLLSTS